VRRFILSEPEHIQEGRDSVLLHAAESASQIEAATRRRLLPAQKHGEPFQYVRQVQSARRRRLFPDTIARDGGAALRRSSAGTMTFDPATLNKLRDLLNPVRDRYGFNYTMERWAELVLSDDLHPVNANKSVEPIENETELVAHILGVPPETVNLIEDEPVRGRGRPRKDMERHAALLLAVIFHEYTRRKPTRITRSFDVYGLTNALERDKAARFYQFATACFEAIGLKASEDAFREATERWERSKAFFKRRIQQVLWGRLPVFGKRSNDPEFASNTKPLRPRKKSPTT
jgi:hypothetical protein